MPFNFPGDPISGIVGIIGGEREWDQSNAAAATARQAAEREAQRQRDWAGTQAEIQREFNREEAIRARESGSYEAAQQRAWQKDMSDTAHQREARDLEAAGLNRILSVSKGGPGASTPSGSTGANAAASAGLPSGAAAAAVGAPMRGHTNMRDAINSALQAKRNQVEADLTEQQTSTQRSQEVLNSATSDLNRALYERTHEEARLIKQKWETEKNITNTARSNADIASSNAKGAQLEGQIDETTYGKVMRYINRAVRGLTGGSSAYRNLTQ